MKHVVGAPDRTRTCNRRLRRPMLYPVELQAQSPRGRAQRGRGRGIRTPDFCVPNATLYQTELYPARDTDHYRYAKLSNATGDVSSSQSVFEHARLQSAWPAARCSAPRSGERRKRRPLVPEVGAPGEIRTPDRLVRSQVLYPAELRARTSRPLAGCSSHGLGAAEPRSGIIPIWRPGVNTFLDFFCHVAPRIRHARLIPIIWPSKRAGAAKVRGACGPG